jgi:hypothetical protein
MMNPRRTIPLIVLALLALSVLACAFPGASDTQTAVPVGPAQSGGSGGSQPASGDQTGGESGLGRSDERFIPVPGGVTITQTTPESGNGEHPTFAWEPVDGAARYLLNVYHAEGGGYWSWEGEATEVMLGGFDAPPSPEADGPRLTGPMSWAVVALDADDHFIASSPLRPVAP